MNMLSTKSDNEILEALEKIEPYVLNEERIRKIENAIDKVFILMMRAPHAMFIKKNNPIDVPVLPRDKPIPGPILCDMV